MNDTLATLVADVMGIESSEITDSLSRENEERWDSLNHLRLVTALEETYSIQLTMEEIENIATLSDIDELIDKKSESA